MDLEYLNYNGVTHGSRIGPCNVLTPFGLCAFLFKGVFHRETTVQVVRIDVVPLSLLVVRC